MSQVTKVMCISIFTNIFLSIFKILFGCIGSSGALIADGIHSLSDLMTDFFAIIGGFLSRKPADREHPFGHGNIEYITSLVISFVIMAVGFSVIENSLNKEITMPSLFVAVVSIITITCKYLLSRYILKKGKKYNNQILLASGKESRSDVFSSVVVLVSVLAMQFSKISPIFKYADRVAAIIVGILVIKIGFSILKENLSFMIGRQETDSVYIKKIEEVMMGTEGIISIKSLILLKYGSYYKLTGVVGMNGELTLKEAHHIIDELEEKLKVCEGNIGYITIHMEPDYE